jgi:hypothetical protein
MDRDVVQIRRSGVLGGLARATGTGPGCRGGVGVSVVGAGRRRVGGGKRGCIGAGFARQEAVLVLARLCRYYRLDLADPGLPRPRGFVTLRPAGPVRMRLTRRD